jgi:hypothetical protein
LFIISKSTTEATKEIKQISIPKLEFQPFSEVFGAAGGQSHYDALIVLSRETGTKYEGMHNFHPTYSL